MVWLQVALLPQQSVACQVRVMSRSQPCPLVTVPTTVMVTLVPQQASMALGGSKLQGVPQITPLPGAQVMSGGVPSNTWMLWLHVLLLPQQSVACHVRVMSRLQNWPLVTVLSTVIVTLLPQHAS